MMGLRTIKRDEIHPDYTENRIYISQQQLAFFYTFGYICFHRLFHPDEVVWITTALEKVLDTQGDGKQHDGSRRTMIVPTIDHNEQLCTLLDDDRIVSIASAILGDDLNYASGDGNYYTRDTGWNPDGSYPELFAIKVAFYLNPLMRIRKRL